MRPASTCVLATHSTRWVVHVECNRKYLSKSWARQEGAYLNTRSELATESKLPLRYGRTYQYWYTSCAVRCCAIQEPRHWNHTLKQSDNDKTDETRYRSITTRGSCGSYARQQRSRYSGCSQDPGYVERLEGQAPVTMSEVVSIDSCQRRHLGIHVPGWSGQARKLGRRPCVEFYSALKCASGTSGDRSSQEGSQETVLAAELYTTS